MKLENLSRAAGISEELHELSHCVALLKANYDVRVYDVDTNYEVVRSQDVKRALLNAIEERIQYLNKEAEKL